MRNVSDAQLSQALEGKCRVLKLDSDEEEDMAGTLNVSFKVSQNMRHYTTLQKVG